MCLILLAWHAHPEFPLVVAANRDEYFSRPTEIAHFWPTHPSLLAGRDIQAGGTWMGITREGRFAALTNFREPESRDATPDVFSRGRLVSDFLGGTQPAEAYLGAIDSRADDYRAFNLLCGTLADGLWHYSNRAGSGGATPRMQRLQPCVYGLSNNLLDIPWPKVARGKSAMTEALARLPREDALFELLRDETVHEDAKLPRTGISLEWERVLSAALVRAPHYGTRCSTILMCDGNDVVTFDEQTFQPNATPVAVTARNRFRFKLARNAAS